MAKVRLTWGGNREAQRLADAAYRKVKPKVPKKKSRKPPSLRKQRRLERRKRNRKLRAELTALARTDYKKYLLTSHWKNLRRAALKFYGRSCRICKKKFGLQVHHRHYRSVGREEMVDLDVLCTGCHRNHHEGSVAGCYDPLTEEFLERFSVR